MSAQTRRLSRRNFLLTLGAGGAAAATVIVNSGSAPQRGAQSGGQARTRVGYQESEHIRNYYRTAKV
jgi:hypothetical protein